MKWLRATAVRVRWIALLLLGACVLAACGGSGSSGFDGEPASEPQTIMNAVEGGSCETFDGQTYCGSGAPFTSDGVTGAVSIDEPATPVICTELPAGSSCVTSVSFTPEGFPAAAAYFIASSESFEGPWVLSSDATAPSGNPEQGREGDVELPTSGSAGPPTPLIVAVLVYFDGVSQLPNGVHMLADFGANVIYISHKLDVSVEP